MAGEMWAAQLRTVPQTSQKPLLLALCYFLLIKSDQCSLYRFAIRQNRDQLVHPRSA